VQAFELQYKGAAVGRQIVRDATSGDSQTLNFEPIKPPGPFEESPRHGGPSIREFQLFAPKK